MIGRAGSICAAVVVFGALTGTEALAVNKTWVFSGTTVETCGIPCPTYAVYVAKVVDIGPDVFKLSSRGLPQHKTVAAPNCAYAGVSVTMNCGVACNASDVAEVTLVCTGTAGGTTCRATKTVTITGADAPAAGPVAVVADFETPKEPAEAPAVSTGVLIALGLLMVGAGAFAIRRRQAELA